MDLHVFFVIEPEMTSSVWSFLSTRWSNDQWPRHCALLCRFSMRLDQRELTMQQSQTYSTSDSKADEEALTTPHIFRKRCNNVAGALHLLSVVSSHPLVLSRFYTAPRTTQVTPVPPEIRLCTGDTEGNQCNAYDNYKVSSLGFHSISSRTRRHSKLKTAGHIDNRVCLGFSGIPAATLISAFRGGPVICKQCLSAVHLLP